MFRALLFLALVAILSVSLAAPTLVSRDDTGAESINGPRRVLLANFGLATTTLSFFYKGEAPKSTSVSSGRLFSSGKIITAQDRGYINYTIPFVFDKGVGQEGYKFTVHTISGKSVSIEGTFVVAGFVIKEGTKIVSGDEAPGVSVGQTGTYKYGVEAIGTDGAKADLTGVKISFKELSGVYMKEVNSAVLDSESFTMTLNPYRVGTGSFLVDFDAPSIAKDGEIFQNLLNVKQDTSNVPCVATGGDYKIGKGGQVSIPMYNLGKPPRASPVSKVVLSVGGKSFDFERGVSDLGIPDQTVVFRPTVVGKASITCDGERAKVVGKPDLSISGTVPRQPTGKLAKDATERLRESADYKIFTAIITVVNSDPNLLEAKDSKAIVDKMCSVIKGVRCVVEKVSRGSAVLDTAAYLPKTVKDEVPKRDLKECFDTCKCQTDLGYKCNELVLGKMNVQAKAVSGAGLSATSGVLATWTIVLIAVVGAFAIILLVMLALWAVYRRSAEQSESDYSSSGPLGVPDPSDLLYEQSIVRDIYGRGDFPDGGPTKAAAEARAREADLREEFPRPPSSSGVSRSNATDDASSTYSV